MSKVRFEQDVGLGVVTLDSPPLNLIGDELIADLVVAIDEVEAAEGLRSLLVRGEGTVFSAGRRQAVRRQGCG
jgi:enoyl-CoA hydratase/carnithine racemase